MDNNTNGRNKITYVRYSPGEPSPIFIRLTGQQLTDLIAAFKTHQRQNQKGEWYVDLSAGLYPDRFREGAYSGTLFVRTPQETVGYPEQPGYPPQIQQQGYPQQVPPGYPQQQVQPGYPPNGYQQLPPGYPQQQVQPNQAVYQQQFAPQPIPQQPQQGYQVPPVAPPVASPLPPNEIQNQFQNYMASTDSPPPF